jgi:hypothetical protein
MKLILAGAAMMTAGLALLLAMVVRLIDPGLALALLGYATLFVGMLLGLAGVTRYARRPHE